MRPKILSPNVLSTVGEIGNVINKTIVVPNIITIKGMFQVHPWVFIVTFDTHPKCPIPYSGIYLPIPCTVDKHLRNKVHSSISELHSSRSKA